MMKGWAVGTCWQPGVSLIPRAGGPRGGAVFDKPGSGTRAHRAARAEQVHWEEH